MNEWQETTNVILVFHSFVIAVLCGVVYLLWKNR